MSFSTGASAALAQSRAGHPGSVQARRCDRLAFGADPHTHRLRRVVYARGRPDPARGGRGAPPKEPEAESVRLKKLICHIPKARLPEESSLTDCLGLREQAQVHASPAPALPVNHGQIPVRLHAGNRP